MATEVNFYHLTRSSLEDTLPRLLAKTLQAGERAVVLLGSAERVDALNAAIQKRRNCPTTTLCSAP